MSLSPSLELNRENNSNKGLVGPPKQSTDGSIQLQGRYSQHILLCARHKVGTEQGLGWWKTLAAWYRLTDERQCGPGVESPRTDLCLNPSDDVAGPESYKRPVT